MGKKKVTKSRAKTKKVCILCKNFYFSDFCPGFSEYTPGWDASMECVKGKWGIGGLGRVTEEEFYKCMHMAEKCKHFEMREDK